MTACNDDVIDDGVFDDDGGGGGDFDIALPTFRCEPEMRGYHVTADVTESSMPHGGDDDSSEFEQTEGSEEWEESGCVGNDDDDDVDDTSEREDRNSRDVTGERPGAGNDEFDDASRSEPRTGNSSVDACVCSAGDDVDTDWSCQAESSRAAGVTSKCEENVMPP